MRRREVAVARIAARADAFTCEIECAVDRRKALRLELDLDTAALGDLVGVTEETEPGHVRDGVRF